MDPEKKQCRLACNTTTSFYDWKLRECVTCPSESYLWTTNNTCLKCPANCTHCQYNAKKKKLECTSCTEGNRVDPMTKTCRLQCPTDSQYEFFQMKCVPCGNGYWLNQTSQYCQRCPYNCTSCEENLISNTPHCTQCNRGLYADEGGVCRKQCSEGKYMDKQLKACTPCFGLCAACSAFDTCTACQDGFYLNKTTGLCIERCNTSTGLFWNASLKKCTEKEYVVMAYRDSLFV